MRLLLLPILLLAACSDGNSDRPKSAPRPPQTNTMTAWVIGPINADGKNYSIGTPLHPTRTAEGFELTISPTAEPHYVMRAGAPIFAFRMRYRVEGDADAQIHGKGCSQASPSAVTIHFTSRPTDFSGDGYRWWATFASQPLAAPFEGEREIYAAKDGAWTSALTKTKATHPADFAAAWAQAKQVGFTFANCEGYGHGARATKPVRFIVTGFEILPAPAPVPELPAAIGERG